MTGTEFLFQLFVKFCKKVSLWRSSNVRFDEALIEELRISAWSFATQNLLSRIRFFFFFHFLQLKRVSVRYNQTSCQYKTKHFSPLTSIDNVRLKFEYV